MNYQINRPELKRKARTVIAANYLYLLSLVLLLSLVDGGFFNFNVSLTVNGEINYFYLTFLNISFLKINEANFLTILHLSPYILTAGIFFKVFITNVIRYGVMNCFLKTGCDSSFDLFSGFKNNYWNIVNVQFMKNLSIFLWGLLLFVPGIIKMFDYYFAEYILGNDPTLSYKEVLEQSKKMTQNHRVEIFVLELSFFPWLLVSAILHDFTFGLAYSLIQPYIFETKAQLYLDMQLNQQIDSLTL